MTTYTTAVSAMHAARGIINAAGDVAPHMAVICQGLGRFRIEPCLDPDTVTVADGETHVATVIAGCHGLVL